MKTTFSFFMLFLFLAPYGNAQGLSREEVEETIIPSFSLYKDTYFISGVPLHTNISEETADAKYQISFKQLITPTSLIFDSYLFLTYTQKAFWNIYEFSSPFREINFNPGIGLGIPVFDRTDHLTGLAELKVEHESNGRDSIYSRGWNSISAAYHTRLTPRMLLSVEAWIPFAYKEGNPDLFDYIGYGELNLGFDVKPEKILLELSLRKGMEDWKGSFRSRLFFRVSKNMNQYFMLEWYNGYGENLLGYNRHRSMLRFGYVIKSSDLDILKRKP